MKKKILLATSIIAIGSYFLSSYREGPASMGYDCTGAETACTGSYAGYTGCAPTGGGRGCHATTASTAITTTIKLDSAGGVSTTRYVPGMTYTVTFTGNNTSGSNTNFGFQLACMKGIASATTVSNAGTWSSTGMPTNVHITPAGSYTYLNIIEHDAVLALSGSTTTFTYSFVWTAPAAGTGNISFWGATNFVNNNGGADGGDIWNTGTLQVTEEAPLGVSAVVNNEAVTVYPNPVMNMLNVAINGAQGEYQVAVYDLSGNMIINETANAAVTTLNTSNWANGMYYVSITKDGNAVKVLPVVKK